MKLVVGLGNPGVQYARTRHNIGFVVIDTMIIDFAFVPSDSQKMQATIARGEITDKKIILAKPQTFMNDSGKAVQAIMSFYKIDAKDLIVVHDDKDIALGEYRVHQGRGAAGHNGVLSIFETIGTQDFTRIRIGIAAKPGEALPQDTADFVLDKFSNEEQKTLQPVLAAAINDIIKML